MIHFKTSLGSFQIPTSYSDITVGDLAFFRSNQDNPSKQIELLTGLNSVEFSVIDFEPVMKHFGFLKDLPLDVIEPSREIRINDKFFQFHEDMIGVGQWGQKIFAIQQLEKNRLLHALAVYLQPEYDGTEFDNEKLEPIVEQLQKLDVDSVYSCIIHVINKLKAFSDKEEKALKSNVTEEQVRAGIAMFNELGIFNTIDMIAGGDVLKHPEVLKVDYNTIFLKLYKNNITVKFERNYQAIINPPTKKKT